jgi:hypothetical protein
MGFWRTLQDVTSLGGTYRLRNQQDRFKGLFEIYNRVRSQIAQCCADLSATLARINKQVGISRRRLKLADRMLNPLGNGRGLQTGTDPSSDAGVLMRGPSAALSVRNFREATEDYRPMLIGIGAGAVGAAASWGAVQLLAHASTGAAMAGLHGAAATSAGWAWFGGGSLAAGGGGIAAGHLLLPGIGTIIAVGVSSTMSHREANKVAKACKDLEGANERNPLILSKGQSDLKAIRGLEAKLAEEDKLLAEVIRRTRFRLFGFGFLSHMWRLLRFWILGYYYTSQELSLLEELDAAVTRFISAFARN